MCVRRRYGRVDTDTMIRQRGQPDCDWGVFPGPGRGMTSTQNALTTDSRQSACRTGSLCTTPYTVTDLKLANSKNWPENRIWSSAATSVTCRLDFLLSPRQALHLRLFAAAGTHVLCCFLVSGVARLTLPFCFVQCTASVAWSSASAAGASSGETKLGAPAAAQAIYEQMWAECYRHWPRWRDLKEDQKLVWESKRVEPEAVSSIEDLSLKLGRGHSTVFRVNDEMASFSAKYGPEHLFTFLKCKDRTVDKAMRASDKVLRCTGVLLLTCDRFFLHRPGC
jgi:hypothetical protein